MMYTPWVRSTKHLLILTVLFPVVLLHLEFPNYEGFIVSQCERQSYAFAARERIYAEEGGSPAYSDSNQNHKTYEIEKSQRPFECISKEIQWPRTTNLESTVEYQDLKRGCNYRQRKVHCDLSYPYRRMDGTCNNLINVKWGSVRSCVKRFLPASYDGISGFRKSVCGIPLPEPRILSLIVFKNVDILSQDLTTVFTYFSQVVSHDISNTPKSTVGGQNIDCCSKRFNGHPQCAPIRIPLNDPDYSKFNVTCLNFVRAAPCGSCSLGKRKTMILPTSYIDCSFLYGTSRKAARNLRRNDGTGKLIVQTRTAGELLPPDVKSGSNCGSSEKSEYCFKAGDGRVNQQTPLASFHTIFLREHNRIADILRQLNPHWREETIYQETRKIVIAEMQIIVYNEFLPLLVGSDYMDSYDLSISNGWSRYDPLVNPNIYAEFTFAAYRLHSLISTVVTDIGADGGKRNLSEFVNKSAAPIYHDEMDTLLEGMCLSPSGLMDRFTTRDITATLFGGGKNPGVDLLSIDIQRGRDAGVPPYAEIIRYLSGGKKNINTFDDLATIFQPADVQLLKSLYCDPRDIDYFVGMHFERPGEEGVLRDSAAEIVAKQFRNLKFGDRFYFEHFRNFNREQLRAIKKVTLATLLCENTNLLSVQKNPMKFGSRRNPIKRCQDIPKLNLIFWKA